MKTNSRYQALNHNNEFVNFDGIKKITSTDRLLLKFNDLSDIEITTNHRFIDINNNQIFASDLVIGSKLKGLNNTQLIVTEITEIKTNEDVYDLINVGTDSLYLTNNVISHNCSFLGSGNNFVDEKYITAQEKKYVIEPIRKEYTDKNFWIWEDPIDGERYIVTVDVSTGSGADYSSIVILKLNKNSVEEVAEYHGKVHPDVLGEIAYGYAKKYNNAYVVVDITGGIGVPTIEYILESGHDNVHYCSVRNKALVERLEEYEKKDENDKPLIPGFTIGTNRGMVLQEMERAIRTEELIIRSSRFTSELKTFVTVEGPRVADHRRSFNDDIIMGAAMGLYVLAYELGNNSQKEIDRLKAMLSAWKKGGEKSNQSLIKNKYDKTNQQRERQFNKVYGEHAWLLK